MKSIWLINPYGNLPSEGWSDYRTFLIGKYLSINGFNVIWFISNFDHRNKTIRNCTDIKINDNFLIAIIKTTTYRNHISFNRIIYERRYAKNLISRIQSYDNPYMVIISEPAMFYYDILGPITNSSSFKKIVDVIDLWPEVFYTFFPYFSNKFLDLLFFPIIKRRMKFIKKFDMIFSVSTVYDVIIKKKLDIKSEVIYLGTSTSVIHSQNSNLLTGYINSKKHLEKWVIYSGTLGDNYDLKTLLNVSKRIQSEGSFNIKFFIAGSGPLESYIKESIQKSKLTNVYFLGFVENKNLMNFLTHCDIGICSYKKNSFVSIPLKAFDYLRASLPILTSLDLEIKTFIIDHDVGDFYRAEDSNDMYNKLTSFLYNHDLQKIKSNCLKLSKILEQDLQYLKILKHI